MKTYFFSIIIAGKGDTPEDAWNDATEMFNEEPGCTPDDYDIEDFN